MCTHSLDYGSATAFNTKVKYISQWQKHAWSQKLSFNNSFIRVWYVLRFDTDGNLNQTIEDNNFYSKGPLQ